MKCYECGSTFRELRGNLEVPDECVGPFLVPDVVYDICDQCGEMLFPPATAKAIEEKRGERIAELLRNRPLSAFFTAAETASVLGISRQALHKHRRIRRGFIHQITFGGGFVYLKDSVMMFKMIGDGRIPLYRHDLIHDPGYLHGEPEVHTEPVSNYESRITDTTPLPKGIFEDSHQTMVART